MLKGGICLSLLLGLSCLILLVLAGPAPTKTRKRRRRGVEEEGEEGGDLLEGSGDLGDDGGLVGEEASNEKVVRGREVKESRGTYFFCELHLAAITTVVIFIMDFISGRIGSLWRCPATRAGKSALKSPSSSLSSPSPSPS